MKLWGGEGRATVATSAAPHYQTSLIIYICHYSCLIERRSDYQVYIVLNDGTISEQLSTGKHVEREGSGLGRHLPEVIGKRQTTMVRLSDLLYHITIL